MGQPLRVAEVNGQKLSVAPVELASRATLDIRGDGSFTDDPRRSLDLQALAAGERSTDAVARGRRLLADIRYR